MCISSDHIILSMTQSHYMLNIQADLTEQTSKSEHWEYFPELNTVK